MKSERIGARTREASVWVFAEEVYLWVIGFGGRIFLARLLSPREFGIVALVLLVQGLVLLLGLRGISAALIRHKEDEDTYANAAFWLTGIVGVLMGVIQIAVAPLAARIYREPILLPLLLVSSIAFFVTPWGATHAVLLQKHLRFRERALRHMVLNTINTAGTVVMALRGYGVWSVVIPPLLVDPIEAYVNWRLYDWRPRLVFDRAHWREVINFGKHVLGADVLRYLIDNTDYMLLGRLAGARVLGLYSFAFRQAMFAMKQVTLGAMRITFPAFALQQDDPDGMRRSFSKMLLLLSSVTLPLQMGQFVLAREYIAVIYSPKWLPAVEAFRILLLYGTAVATASVGRQLLNVMGRPDLTWKYQAVVWPILVAGILLGVGAGINGVATAVGIILGLSSWLFLLYTCRLLGWPLTTALAPLGPPLASAAIMLAVVGALRFALIRAGASAVLILVACVPAGVVTYAVCLAALFPQAWRDITTFLVRAVKSFGKDGGKRGRGRGEETRGPRPPVEEDARPVEWPVEWERTGGR